MINPLERKPNHPLTLSTVQLIALLAYVNRDGELKERDGYKGETITEDDAVVVSEGALWVLKSGDVVQLCRIPEAEALLNFPGLVRQTISLHEAAMVVTEFGGGILGASRAMVHATVRVLTDLEAFQGLVTLSDEALDYAVGSNLKTEVSQREHLQNIAELEELVRSGGELANEIRTFLEAIKSAKDRRKRHNVYRMVLITRAVQRRAKTIGEAKGDTLEAVTTIGLDVAHYVGAVTATAAKIRTELNDEQLWWTGSDGDLPHQTAVRRRKNFIARLRQYRTELLAITAKPFRCWTFAAADRLQDLADWIESGQYSNVLTDARYIVALMDAILVREGVSRCIAITTRPEDVKSRRMALSLLTDVNLWITRHTSVLGLAERTRPIYDQVLWITNDESWNKIAAVVRTTEQYFDALMT